MSDIRTSFKSIHDEHLAEKFRAGGVVYAQRLPLSAQACLAWNLWEMLQSSIVLVVDRPQTVDLLYRDLHSLGIGREEQVRYYPALESTTGRASVPNPDIMGDPIETLLTFMDERAHVILVTCVQALMQKTMAPPELARAYIHLKIAEEIEPDDLVARLEAGGYELDAEVQVKGQASRRGGLLDVWPVTEPWPVRIEFFGSVIESFRFFDPATQMSVGRCPAIRIAPASESGGHADGTDGCLMDFLPDHTRWVWSDDENIRQHADVYEESMVEAGATDRVIRYDQLRADVEERFGGGQLVMGCDMDAGALVESDFQPCEGLPAVAGHPLHPDVMEGERGRFVESLWSRADAGDRVHLFFSSEGSRGRFEEAYLAKTGVRDNVSIHVAPLSGGFQRKDPRLVVVGESDIYGQRKTLRGRYDLHARKAGPRKEAGARVADWTDIQPGDLVVHLDHGIGKYLGMYEIEFSHRMQEVLSIEYAHGAKLYVPVSQTHLLSRYVGVGKKRPNLHILGGKRWGREKVAAQQAIQDLAASLLETQAARQTLAGHSFSHDTDWQHEFEGGFPYEETDDQDRAVREVKEDMESAQPMDRLICGDVGYGKTEVALRAAFKTVMDGKQVAVLVPTTVLAQQHYTTFSERMAAFPVNIGMLSRFRTRAQQSEVVKRLKSGGMDIVIGTHRLLQKDVAFKDLGLVIVDEEQRFGVKHKEHLKQLRKLVDVLTMTATPIPRTLYMSLTGAKDMSTIQTPPQERLPVETVVIKYDDDAIRQAILRELNRGGQVFYLHNRVMTINKVFEHLSGLVPEARFEVAHGQMSERTLEVVMTRFVRGEFDVLVCTTIIESGVDIPNVNTILIDRADRFGMADLYQLRGRVGRYKHKAYAYLLLPGHIRLFESARSRIRAIQKHSSLGSGFKLALQDLELRGAGNLLGAQQSGHITAVGFDLYCQFLKRTVAHLKGEPLPPIIDVETKLDFIELAPEYSEEDHAAVIPYAYIEDENHRLAIYRKIAAAALEEEIDALQEELKDRFGAPPAAMEHLLLVARIRIVAAQYGVDSVEVREDKIMLIRNNDYLMRNRRFPRLTSTKTAKRLEEIMAEIKSWDAST